MSPRLVEGAARQGTKMPFAEAVEELRYFWRVWVSEDTLRRQTEGAGAAAVALEEEEVARLEREFPAPPIGPAVQQVSIDGAMVHLTDGSWAEVKTAATGRVTTRADRDGERVVQTTDFTYCSRLADVAAFRRRFKLAVYARGIQTAGTVVAVQDGAAWIQGIVDHFRPDAVRVLDFAHLVEHLATAARAVYGIDTPELRAWIAAAASTLKRHGPAEVLTALDDLPVARAADRAAAALRDAAHAYLAARVDQAQYPTFQAEGYPIGSGCVESAGKLIVEARLKGTGMRWERRNVCPMVALRAVRASGRWDQTWPAICSHLRQQDAQRRRARWLRRHPVPATPAAPATPTNPRPKLSCAHQRLRTTASPTSVAGKPTADHPWNATRSKAG